MSKLYVSLAAFAVLSGPSASAAVFDVDNFSHTPVESFSSTGLGTIVSTLVNTSPEATLTAASFINPDDATTTVSYGGGGLSLASPTNGLAYAVMGYDAFARPATNPSIDTTPYNYYELTFASANQPLNINFLLYSGSPTGPNTYYTSNGVNVAPAGHPFTVFLPILDTPGFNRADVNGLLFEIDVAGSSRGSAWTITDFALTSSAPEPDAWALALVGFGAMGAVLRARRTATA